MPDTRAILREVTRTVYNIATILTVLIAAYTAAVAIQEQNWDLLPWTITTGIFTIAVWLGQDTISTQKETITIQRRTINKQAVVIDGLLKKWKED